MRVPVRQCARICLGYCADAPEWGNLVHKGNGEEGAWRPGATFETVLHLQCNEGAYGWQCWMARHHLPCAMVDMMRIVGQRVMADPTKLWTVLHLQGDKGPFPQGGRIRSLTSFCQRGRERVEGRLAGLCERQRRGNGACVQRTGGLPGDMERECSELDCWVVCSPQSVATC
jgi:hypothetical protein